MRSYTLSYRLPPTTVSEASTREVFMNSLEIDIIKPLAVLKVRLEFLLGTGPFTDIWSSESKMEMR